MTPSQAPARERPGGYRRSSSGLLGAMIATVAAVLVFVAFRGLNRDNDVNPTPAVDWQISYKSARADDQLQVLAPPARLSPGWKATSVSYMPGNDPAWHLGLLTSRQQYVGIYESRDSLDDLVQQHVNGQARAGEPVTVHGATWQVFTGPKGDYALGRTVQHAGPREAQLVVGTTSPARVRAFVGTLTPGSPTG